MRFGELEAYSRGVGRRLPALSRGFSLMRRSGESSISMTTGPLLTKRVIARIPAPPKRPSASFPPPPPAPAELRRAQGTRPRRRGGLPHGLRRRPDDGSLRRPPFHHPQGHRLHGLGRLDARAHGQGSKRRYFPNPHRTPKGAQRSQNLAAKYGLAEQANWSSLVKRS